MTETDARLDILSKVSQLCYNYVLRYQHCHSRSLFVCARGFGLDIMMQTANLLACWWRTIHPTTHNA